MNHKERWAAYWMLLTPREKQWHYKAAWAIRRAKERYGLILTGADLMQIRYDIWRGRCIPVGQDKAMRLYLVKVQGRKCCVGFNERLFQVVTFRSFVLPGQKEG